MLVIKEVTRLMIHDYNLRKTGCDFMGYKLDRNCVNARTTKPIQFHHLIIPKRNCKGIEAEGYVKWNGALLINDSHEYLHKIENYDREMFEKITNLMVSMNQQGFLDKDTLLEIRAYLLEFEEKYKHESTKKGKKLIKRPYVYKRMSQEDIETNNFIKRVDK